MTGRPTVSSNTAGDLLGRGLCRRAGKTPRTAATEPPRERGRRCGRRPVRTARQPHATGIQSGYLGSRSRPGPLRSAVWTSMWSRWGAQGGARAVSVNDFPRWFPAPGPCGQCGVRGLYAPHVNAAAERGFRLVSYERPGYGQSRPRPGRTVARALPCRRRVDLVGMRGAGIRVSRRGPGTNMQCGTQYDSHGPARWSGHWKLSWATGPCAPSSALGDSGGRTGPAAGAAASRGRGPAQRP